MGAPAQEALRASMAGERIAEARAKALRDREYNLQLGRLSLNFVPEFSAEYNDNINSYGLDPERDVLLRPALTTAGNLPLSEQNALNFSVGVGYLKYLDHPEYDRFQVTPETSLEFDVFAGQFRFTAYERASYSVDPVSNSSVSGAADFGGLENTAGLRATWDLNRVVLMADYGHQNWVSSTDRYAYLDRASELVNLRVGYQFSEALTAGPEATAALTRYDQEILHGSLGASLGAYADWRVTERITARLRAGAVAYDFDDPDAAGLTGDPRTYYFQVGIEHRVNPFLTSSLDAGRDLRLSTESDYMELFTVQLALRWRLVERLDLTTYGVYEIGSQPEFVRITDDGILFRPGEDWDRIGAGCALGYPLMRKVSATLSYRFYFRNSDVETREYTQNSVTLAFRYRF